MSTPAPVDPTDDRKRVRWTQRIRKRPPSSRPTPEQLRRQDSVLQSAWRHLRASDPVIAFLNTHNEQLGRLPLHLALESDEGPLRVEALLEEIAAKGTVRRA